MSHSTWIRSSTASAIPARELYALTPDPTGSFPFVESETVDAMLRSVAAFGLHEDTNPRARDASIENSGTCTSN